MKNDTKIEEALTCRFKIDVRNFTGTQALESLKNLCFNWLLVTCGLKKDSRNFANFHQSTCQNWDFDGILLSKVEKV